MGLISRSQNSGSTRVCVDLGHSLIANGVVVLLFVDGNTTL